MILVKADNKELGMVGFVAIRMAEVSSCVTTVAAGQYIRKGQDMGSFHYGGSSCCLPFGARVTLPFSPLVKATLKPQPVRL